MRASFARAQTHTVQTANGGVQDMVMHEGFLVLVLQAGCLGAQVELNRRANLLP